MGSVILFNVTNARNCLTEKNITNAVCFQELSSWHLILPMHCSLELFS